jgi:predicted lipoprotein with Yx(FWY)xxD motif
MTRVRALALAALIAVAAAVLAVAAAGATSRAPALRLRSTSLGRVIVDSHGRTLYMLTHDRRDKSRCYHGCSAVWPPAAARRRARVGHGLKQRKLTVIRRRGGGRQLAFAGHPLYRYAGDSGAGEVNGEGIHSFGGVWYALRRSGAPVTAAPAPSSPSPGYGGYSYGY